MYDYHCVLIRAEKRDGKTSKQAYVMGSYTSATQAFDARDLHNESKRETDRFVFAFDDSGCLRDVKAAGLGVKINHYTRCR